jgi:hypothetical protein
MFMSLEIYVLSDRKLASIADWQTAIDAEGFALRVSNGAVFEALRGFLPMQLHGRSAGCECSHSDAQDVMDNYAEIEFGRRWRHALAFRFGGHINECICAYMVGAAYARATEGCVFDCQEARVLTPGAAANVVRELQKFGK